MDRIAIIGLGYIGASIGYTLRLNHGKRYRVVGFDYDFASFTATWTIERPIAADRVRLELSDDVSDLRGNALDGEWEDNASQYPSGDAEAGGDFRFSFSVLAGDVNDDGAVNRADAAILASNFGVRTGATTGKGDLDGDGAVTVRDVLLLKRSLGQTLPAAAQTAISAESNQPPERAVAADVVFGILAEPSNEDLRASRILRHAARRQSGVTRGIRNADRATTPARRLDSVSQPAPAYRRLDQRSIRAARATGTGNHSLPTLF